MSPSPKGFQSPKFSDTDFREVRGLGRPKSSVPQYPCTPPMHMYWGNLTIGIGFFPSPHNLIVAGFFLLCDERLL
jgi:hypothetical protein